MAVLPIGGRFYKSDSLPISAQECVNLYYNAPQTTSVTKENLSPTPGLTEATTAGTGLNRGSHNFQGVSYFVNGTLLFRIDRTVDGLGVASYASVDVSGGINIIGTERVLMADNGSEGGQICIINPGDTSQFNAYIFTIAGGLVQISDSDFDGPVDSVVYIDGFFLFTKANGQKFFISELRNGLSYIATDFASAEADPDSLVAAVVLHNQPYLFGSQTFEPFQNIGGSGFPFLRIDGGVQQKGLTSKFAIQEVNDILYFLGSGEQETPAIWLTDGSRPLKVSTTAIDNEITKYSDTTLASCFSYQYSQNGHHFVAFTFPGENAFFYDIDFKEWHTRESFNTLNRIVPYRVSTIVEAFGVLLTGDTLTNKIGILEADTFTEYTNEIRRRWITPQLDNDGQPFFINALELFGDSGVGLTTGQGLNPLISMSVSDDGGRTFNNNLTRTMGLIGNYKQRTIWNSLGRFGREVCFKFQVSDPVAWVFSKVEVQIE